LIERDGCFVFNILSSESGRCHESGLPDFSQYNIPKREKYTKIQQNIPKGNKIYQMAIKQTKCQKIYQHLPLQDPQKFTQIAIFDLKMYQLATLPRMCC
jgi:hypothetical protein